MNVGVGQRRSKIKKKKYSVQLPCGQSVAVKAIEQKQGFLVHSRESPLNVLNTEIEGQ